MKERDGLPLWVTILASVIGSVLANLWIYKH